MEPRRKLLTILFAVASIAFGGHWGWTSYVEKPAQVLEKKLARAEKRLATTNRKLVAARVAKLDVDDLSRASLPGVVAVAQERYQAYLIGLLQQARIVDPSINPSQPTQREGVHFIPFTIQADADMAAIARLLHPFYAAERLQQIRRLSLNPIDRKDKGSGIRFSLTIEAMALGEGGAGETERVDSVVSRVDPNPVAYSALAERNVLFASGPGGQTIAANSPEHVVLTGIVSRGDESVADLYDRATDRTRRIRRREICVVGPYRAIVLDLGLRDVLLGIDGGLWRWELGSSFSERTRLSPEMTLERAVRTARRANEVNRGT